MVATQNIDTLGPIWIFSLRGVFTYFEGTANLHCYTSCTLTSLHCSKVSFLQCCHVKKYKIFKKKLRGVLTSMRYCMSSEIYIQFVYGQVRVSHSIFQL